MKRMTLKKRFGRLLTPIFRLLFKFFQHFGFHISRNHFYEPIPDTSKLPNWLWSENKKVRAFSFNDNQQFNILNNVVSKYISECSFKYNSKSEPEFHFGNEYFESVDVEIYHSLIRHFKPKKIIEIGSGFSTLVASNAIKINNNDCELICVEPFPNISLKNGVIPISQLIEKPIQEVDLEIFKNLDSNDILFIDSSHVAKIGSDVLREFLEILIIINPGVLVHIHDIFLPNEYPKTWIIDENKFWTEQYLLEAFLSFNNNYEVIWASSYFSLNFHNELELNIPSWKGSYLNLPAHCKNNPSRDGKNVWPVSFWIRRKI